MNALEPEYVAHQIMKAILRNQEFIILPHVLYCFYALKGLVCVRASARVYTSHYSLFRL